MSASQARTGRRATAETRRATEGAPRPPAPLVLDRYRLHRRLGTGAFGTVWLAHDERLERDVAVKILPRERIVGGRFEREARVAARLAHPGIVTLYEAAVDDQGAYLVSELVRGTTLDELLEAGRLSDRDVLAIGIALCDALAHAHAEGVVHRDVKPSNVLVPEQPASPAQLAKLTDFGVARVVGGDSLTMTGAVIGTLAYMAPEQAEGLEVSATADLYSLALMLYEALTGVNPVRRLSASGRARRLGVHLPPLRRQRRDLPRELGAGLDHALRPGPRERGRIADLRRALVAAQAVVTDEPGVVVQPSWPRPRGHTVAPARETEAWDAPASFHAPAEDPEACSEDDPAGPPPASGLGELPWLAGGLGALGAAATAAWLCARVPSPVPVAPAPAGLVAGGLTLLAPRVGWLALTAAVCAGAAVQGHGGTALLFGVAALIPVLLLARRPPAWPLAAGAPALGLIGLAGAWPALAARAATPWRRAALGLAGWLWLLLAAPMAQRVLYLPRVPGTPPGAVWTRSPDQTLHHVLGSLPASGALAPGAVWAIAALVLPWLVRGRTPALDVIRVVVWAAVLVSATGAALAAAAGADRIHSAPTALLGAVAGAAVALAPIALGVARRAGRWSGSGAQLP